MFYRQKDGGKVDKAVKDTILRLNKQIEQLRAENKGLKQDLDRDLTSTTTGIHHLITLHPASLVKHFVIIWKCFIARNKATEQEVNPIIYQSSLVKCCL